jgi:Kef-type K+ transport system membrane component KefB
MRGNLTRHVLTLAGVMSAVAMIVAARADRPDLVTLAAVLFALIAVAAALAFYRQSRRRLQSDEGAPLPIIPVLLQGSALAAICYAWGAVAMQGLYLTRLTGLKWQHGWQYALAMALLAAASLAFARSLSVRPQEAERHVRWAVPLAAAQACVACVGLTALIVSGKLFSVRADWAANRVFAGLAVAIFAVSVASIIVQRHHVNARRGDVPALP